MAPRAVLVFLVRVIELNVIVVVVAVVDTRTLAPSLCLSSPLLKTLPVLYIFIYLCTFCYR